MNITTDDTLIRSAMDVILHDVLDAREEVAKLATLNPQAKKSAHKVILSLGLALGKLVPLGMHGNERWKALKDKN